MEEEIKVVKTICSVCQAEIFADEPHFTVDNKDYCEICYKVVVLREEVK